MTLTAKLKQSKVTNQQINAVLGNPNYYDQMTSMGRRYKEIDDDTLESMKYEAAWIALSTYDPEKSAFNTHLVGHMRFLCLKELRRMHGSNQQHKNTSHDELSILNVATEDDFDKIDFYNALDTLSNEDKLIMYGHYEDKKCLQELADELHITKQAVSERMKKIRQKIKVSCGT